MSEHTAHIENHIMFAKEAKYKEICPKSNFQTALGT